MKKTKWTASPYLVWMVAFIAVPLAIVVYFAFTDKAGHFTLENIMGLGAYTTVFARSIVLAAIATAICLVLAFPVSYLLSRMRPASQRMMQMLIMLPMWMNFLLRTYAWMSLLEHNGIINRFLGLLGVGPFNMINTSGAVVLGMVYNYLPYMVLPLYTIMVKIDNSVIEAAQDLGANGTTLWQRCWCRFPCRASPRASPWCSCPASPRSSSAACWAAARTCSSATSSSCSSWATATTTISAAP